MTQLNAWRPRFKNGRLRGGMSVQRIDPAWFGRFRRFVQSLIHRMIRDDAVTYAAALAFNFLFALVPLLLFLSALLAFLHLSRDASQLIQGPLTQVLPRPLLAFIVHFWRQLVVRRRPTLLSAGALGFLWGMSGAFRQLIDAMNHAYELPLPRRRPWWKTYALSALAGLSAGLCFTAVIALAGFGTTGLHFVLWIALHRTFPPAGLAALRWLFVLLVLWPALAVLYAVLPDRPLPVRWANPGTLAALGLWFVVSWGFSVYVNHFPTYSKVYGSLTTIILLMLFLYFAGLALVVGAEINAMVDANRRR